MKNNRPLISVIIPLYNTEEYIYDTIDSIANQTLRDIEIIIINDGSTDNSLSIVKRCIENDKRIILYSQENKGQSIARNKGITASKGKYIYFMDSDDLLQSDALECCYLKCESEGSDLVCFDADIFNKQNNSQLNLNYRRGAILKEDISYNGIELLKTLLKHNGYSPSPCLYLINSEYLKSIDLFFYPGIIHEDQLFTAILYLQSKRIQYISEPFFKRRIRANSIMTTTFSMNNMNGYLSVADKLICFSNNHLNTKEAIDMLLVQMLNAVVWLSYKIPFHSRIQIALRCMSRYRKYIKFRNYLVLLFKSFIKK